ncbi:hypothetical protein V1389_01485 [Flavobacterium rakeshii]|uniref:hypothetical protein n=1 Tax=Flavobacterium rakeshii TaxID=1038845 RepID=UPI002E7AC781|nr:hypothetical protein [Flavobacterium rakeshii]MEE1896988.1 hypothetical protein [Flavobacterium rakeshii]
MPEIKLNRDKEMARYVITMFTIVNEAISQKGASMGNCKKHFLQKDLSSPLELNARDLKSLKVRFLEEFLEDTSGSALKLDEQESALFLQCSRAAYCFETERNKIWDIGLRDAFLQYHEQNFSIA